MQVLEKKQIKQVNIVQMCPNLVKLNLVTREKSSHSKEKSGHTESLKSNRDTNSNFDLSHMSQSGIENLKQLLALVAY